MGGGRSSLAAASPGRIGAHIPVPTCMDKVNADFLDQIIRPRFKATEALNGGDAELVRDDGDASTAETLSCEPINTPIYEEKEVENVALASGVFTIRKHPVLTPSVDGQELREDGGGMSGSCITRIELVFEGDKRVFVVSKFTDTSLMEAQNFKIRFFMLVLANYSRWNAIRRESLFFHRYNTEVSDAGVRVPYCYYLGMEQGGRSHTTIREVATGKRPRIRQLLVLEDLHHAGYRTSVVPYSSIRTCQTRVAFQMIARLHAHYWGHTAKHTCKADWMRFYFLCSGSSFRSWRQSFHKVVKRKTLLQKCLSLGWGQQHPSLATQEMRVAWDTIALNQTSLEASWVAMEQGQTLIHGDFHGWNVIFKHNSKDGVAEEAALLDWANFGAGRAAWDVLFFLTLSVEPEWESDREVLEGYYRELVRLSPRIEQQFPLAAFYTEVYSAALLFLVGFVKLRAIMTAADQQQLLDGPPKSRDLALGYCAMARRASARALLILQHRDDPSIACLLPNQ